VTPGFIDPHEHLLGVSGEEGFATQTPEISVSEIICAGITKEGSLAFNEAFLKDSNRKIVLEGKRDVKHVP